MFNISCLAPTQALAIRSGAVLAKKNALDLFSKKKKKITNDD